MIDKAAFEYRIGSNEPVPIGDVSDALKSLQSFYRSTLYKNQALRKSFDERLFVRRVREGSQIYEFIPIVAVGVLPLVAEINASVQLFKHIKGLTEYFVGRGNEPKNIKPKHCKNIIDLTTPGISSDSGLRFGVVEGDVIVNNFVQGYSKEEAGVIVGRATRKKAELELPDVESEIDKILQFVQASALKTSTSGTNSPDKAVIPDISPKAFSVIFDPRIMGQKRKLFNDNNVFTSRFLVDVDIARSGDTIKAYVITKISAVTDI